VFEHYRFPTKFVLKELIELFSSAKLKTKTTIRSRDNGSSEPPYFISDLIL